MRGPCDPTAGGHSVCDGAAEQKARQAGPVAEIRKQAPLWVQLCPQLHVLSPHPGPSEDDSPYPR